MSSRDHVVLRIGAVALLAAVTLWPRSRAAATAELRHATIPARAAVTAQARPAERPRAAKLAVANADEQQTNY